MFPNLTNRMIRLALVALFLAMLSGCSGSVKIGGGTGKKVKKYQAIFMVDLSGSMDSSTREQIKNMILQTMDRLEGRLSAVRIYRFSSGSPKRIHELEGSVTVEDMELIEALKKFVADSDAMSGEGTRFDRAMKKIASLAEDSDDQTVGFVFTDGGDAGRTDSEDLKEDNKKAAEKLADSEVKLWVGPVSLKDENAVTRVENIFDGTEAKIATEADTNASLEAFYSKL